MKRGERVSRGEEGGRERERMEGGIEGEKEWWWSEGEWGGEKNCGGDYALEVDGFLLAPFL